VRVPHENTSHGPAGYEGPLLDQKYITGYALDRMYSLKEYQTKISKIA